MRFPNNKQRFLIAVAVLFVAAAGFVVERLGRANTARIEPDVADQIFGGKKNLDTLVTATEVTAERIHEKQSSNSSPWLLASYDREPPLALTLEQSKELKRLFYQRSSYNWELFKMCAPNYGVLLSFRNERSVIRIALCLHCGLLGVYDAEDARHVNREEDFDPMRQRVLAILKSIFPHDRAIQEGEDRVRSEAPKQ